MSGHDFLMIEASVERNAGLVELTPYLPGNRSALVFARKHGIIVLSRIDLTAEMLPMPGREGESG